MNGGRSQSAGTSQVRIRFGVFGNAGHELVQSRDLIATYFYADIRGGFARKKFELTCFTRIGAGGRRCPIIMTIAISGTATLPSILPESGTGFRPNASRFLAISKSCNASSMQ